jgi:O-antigen/teichoic acid export membrane protein
MGELQGQQRFFALSSLGIAQALLKLIAAIVLGLAFGPVGVVLGVVAGSVVAYGMVFVLLRRNLAIRSRLPWLRPALRYLVVILPSTISLSVLLSADVLLVKHFFNARAAGEYSAVAALGRAIFWGAAGVAAVLFPKVIYRESQGRSGARIVLVSLGLVAVGGVASLTVLGLVARPVLTAFAGSAYAMGSTILPLYAIGMTLLGAALVLITTHQSRARGAFLGVLIPITAAEPVLIVIFHRSVMQVAWVVTLSMAALVTGLALLLAGEPRRRVSDNAEPIVALAEAQA